MTIQTVGTPTTARVRHRRTRNRSSWSVPATLGVFFGGYAAFLCDNNGASTARTATVAVVGFVALAVVCYIVGKWQRSLAREGRSALYGTVFGCAMGYLLSLSGYSVLKASLVGLILGLAMAVTSFYWFYVHET